MYKKSTSAASSKEVSSEKEVLLYFVPNDLGCTLTKEQVEIQQFSCSPLAPSVLSCGCVRRVRRVTSTRSGYYKLRLFVFDEGKGDTGTSDRVGQITRRLIICRRKSRDPCLHVL